MLEESPQNIWLWGHSETQKPSAKESQDSLLEKLLDINPEGTLLKEIKDILDELHMMTKVYSEQQTVVQSFSAHIQKLGRKRNGASQRTKNKASQLVKEISRRKAEIHELTIAAERTADGACRSFPPSPFHQITIFRWLIYMQLKELLDLKQKHANVSEARAGVLHAEEANLILNATRKLFEESAKQTIQGSKQNRSLMIFTIVTIIFVRISRL